MIAQNTGKSSKISKNVALHECAIYAIPSNDISALSAATSPTVEDQSGTAGVDGLPQHRKQAESRRNSEADVPSAPRLDCNQHKLAVGGLPAIVSGPGGSFLDIARPTVDRRGGFTPFLFN